MNIKSRNTSHILTMNSAFFPILAITILYSGFGLGPLPAEAAVAAIARPRQPQSRAEESEAAALPAVIVVGGGVAGLTVGASLAGTGRYNVTLLEAMDRIGGRTHTLRFDGGFHVEMGGEWIHGEERNKVFELAQPLGLLQTDAEPPQMPYQYPLPNGGRLDEDEVEVLEEIYEVVYEDPDEWARPLRGSSLGQYSRIFMEEFLKHHEVEWEQDFFEVVLDWLHRRLLEEESADNWFDASADDAGDQYEILDGRENVTWRPPYGYSSLHELILTGRATPEGEYDLPDWIQLNKEVTTIDYSGTSEEIGVRVCTRDGACMHADHVVFTASLGVLKATHESMFTPALTEQRQLVIDNIGFGSAAKYYLEFSAPWWPSNYSGAYILWDDVEYDYNDPTWQYWRSNITEEELRADLGGLPLWARSIVRIFTVDSRSHPTMLRAWVSGPTAKVLDTWDADYVRETMMALVRKFIGPQLPGVVIPDPVATYNSSWWNNPFTRGVYTYRSLDSDRHDVWARDLSEPLVGAKGKPILCFAGEATHPIFFSAVHGAYESGLREAERIEAWYGFGANGGKATGAVARGSGPVAAMVTVLVAMVLNN